MTTPKEARISASLLLLLFACSNAAHADDVVADDQIVQGSLCVGIDCINNESFGFDTLRLKENNLRIHFDDTSVSAGFPNNQWRIVANDSASGGANYLAIVDAGTDGLGTTQSFRVDAGAPSNSLFVSSAGKIGLRTSTPALDLHITTGNTPAIRFDQNNASGFTPQAWDIGANEANFFVRDFTGGNRLPFRIRPGAPTSSIDISATGNVGIGTASPAAALHVVRNDGTAQLRVEEASATTQARTLLDLRNNGGSTLSLSNSATTGWNVTGDTALTIATQGNSGTPQFSLASNGNIAITGTLSTGSSRTLKTAIVPIDASALLDKLMSMTIYSWRYKTSPAQETHVGPMAEDFHATFNLGADPKALAPADVAGVTLGAVQALAQKVEQREKDIADVRARIAAIEARLAAKQPR